MQRSFWQNACLLVVDDQESNVRLVERLVAQAGYSNVHSTTDARQVLPLFQQLQPDLLLLDLHMPYLDGFEVMRQLQALIADDDYLPILVLTADVTPQAKQRALAGGAMDFLTKPLDAIEVSLRVRNLLETRYLYRQLQNQNQLLEARVRERTRELVEREQQVRELARRLLVAHEEEHRRIAYELHDGLAQVAASAYQHLQAFASRYNPRGTQAQQDLRRSLELLHHTVGEARRIIAGMRPTVLDDFGLATALRMHVEQLCGNGWQIEYHEALPPHRLPQQMETALFRVAQEALRNVERHADTRRARVALLTAGDQLLLEVQDWGRGFDLARRVTHAAPGQHIGLHSMQERVALLGGHLEIQSQPGAGTLVRAVVPLDQPSTEG